MSIRSCRLSGLGRVLIALLLAALAPAGAAAQELVVPLQFSFSDPGARSMGFGGAFVALADDATAALANPAGLVQLVRPEVAIEGRLWSYSTPYTQRGRVEGVPSGIGVDTTLGVRTSRSEEEARGLSFLSVTYPRGRWAVAFYRHRLADFEFQAETRGLVGGGTSCCQIRLFDQQATADFAIVTYGVSGAFRVNERLALGLGALYHEASFDARATMFLPVDGPDGLLGPTAFLPERAVLTERNFFESTDWAFAAGLLFRVSERWTFGGVYRQGPEVKAGAEITAGAAADPEVPAGEVLFRVTDLDLDLPGLAGLGLAYRAPGDRLTLSFQWDRIDYSSIVTSLRLDDRAIDDVDELHVGAEYVFLDSTPILAFRAGIWLDPDHQLRARTDDPFIRALLPRGDDDLHYTAGLGLAFDNLQIDLAIDLSDRLDALSISSVYSF